MEQGPGTTRIVWTGQDPPSYGPKLGNTWKFCHKNIWNSWSQFLRGEDLETQTPNGSLVNPWLQQIGNLLLTDLELRKFYSSLFSEGLFYCTGEVSSDDHIDLWRCRYWAKCCKQVHRFQLLDCVGEINLEDREFRSSHYPERKGQRQRDIQLFGNKI